MYIHLTSSLMTSQRFIYITSSLPHYLIIEEDVYTFTSSLRTSQRFIYITSSLRTSWRVTMLGCPWQSWRMLTSLIGRCRLLTIFTAYWSPVAFSVHSLRDLSIVTLTKLCKKLWDSLLLTVACEKCVCWWEGLTWQWRNCLSPAARPPESTSAETLSPGRERRD